MSNQKTKNTSSQKQVNRDNTPKNESVQTNTSSTAEQNTSTLEQTNTSSTAEQKSANPNTQFTGVQANGDSYNYDVTLTFKADVNQSVATKTTEKTAEIINAFNGMSKGYFTMVSSLAVIISNKYYNNIVGIKSPQEFLVKVVGTPKSTASELCKVAKRFYTALGNLKDKELGLFTYSELVKLADKDDVIIDGVIDRIKAVGEKHTRNDVIKAIQAETEKALGVEDNKSESKSDSKSDSKSESKSDSKENNKSDNKEDSGKDFEPVDGDTPFSTKWSDEYVIATNKLVDIADSMRIEIDEKHNTNYEDIAKGVCGALHSLVKEMLDLITNNKIE